MEASKCYKELHKWAKLDEARKKSLNGKVLEDFGSIPKEAQPSLEGVQDDHTDILIGIQSLEHNSVGHIVHCSQETRRIV